jgi:hypothetical protein
MHPNPDLLGDARRFNNGDDENEAERTDGVLFDDNEDDEGLYVLQMVDK